MNSVSTVRKEVFSINKISIHKKRKAFCCNYVLCGNITEAAVKAGFDRETALTDGINCLRRADCKTLISQLHDVLSGEDCVTAGLKRLAFGSCSDAVYLVLADEAPPQSVIETLDLFNVSELKRIKGGGLELKLFDRQKALEKLFEYQNSSSDRGNAQSLIAALTASSDENADGEAL